MAQTEVTLQKLTNGFDANPLPGPVLAVGSPVTWTYVVTNTGIDPLTNVTVTDDQGVAVSCPATTLAVGESMTCTGAGIAQEGQYENFGLVTAQLPGGQSVNAFDISHYFGQVVFLKKATNQEDADAPPGPLLDPGDPVTWTYVVTNPGPDAVSGLAVTDDQGVVVSCPGTTLAAGEFMTCTASGVVQPGQYANVGTVTALLPAGGTVSASDPSHYFGRLLRLEKATNGQDADLPPGPVLPIGAAVAWTYVVTNTGTETLTAVAVSDDQGVTVTCPATTLAAGESMTCTANGVTVAGQYANLGTVTATHPTVGQLTDSDPSHYFGQDQAISLSATKTAALAVDANGNGVANPGDTLSYTVVLVNGGPGPATGVVFNDTPDPNTALVVGSVTTTAGTVTGGNGAGDAAVGVDVGTLAGGGGSVTIVFRVTIDDPLSPGVTQVVNQGVFSGGNFPDVPTDDPGQPGGGGATAFAVAQEVLSVPSLSQWGLLALAGLLAGLGLRRMTAGP